jgi:hypothetical protein
MRSTLRGTCERCGLIEVPISEALLVLSLEDSGGDSRNLAEVACPKCGLRNRQRVDERTTRLLSAAGIQLVAPAMRPRGVQAGDRPGRGGDVERD